MIFYKVNDDIKRELVRRDDFFSWYGDIYEAYKNQVKVGIFQLDGKVINYIKSYQEGSGFAIEIIDYIFKEFNLNELTGISLFESIQFWHHIGSTFNDDDLTTLLKEDSSEFEIKARDLLDNDYPEFYLKKEVFYERRTNKNS